MTAAHHNTFRERPADALMREVVNDIVGGHYATDQLLPPEAALAQQFQVSRTIVRECMKRLEEKGVVLIRHGIGTVVCPSMSWNVLDPLVLRTIIAHDEELHTLDELTAVRALLEGLMTFEAVGRLDAGGLSELLVPLQRMRDHVTDYGTFIERDVEFHTTVMRLSGNFLASNIAHTLFGRARPFARYEGTPGADAAAVTLAEHEGIYAAMAAGDAVLAQERMVDHISDSWQRRSTSHRRVVPPLK